MYSAFTSCAAPNIPWSASNKQGPAYPSDDRELALHTLSFTLKLDEAWPLTRQLLLIMAPKMEQAGARNSWSVYLESGLEQSQQLRDTETEAELRFHLGVLYQYLTEYDKAHLQYESSAAHFEKAGRLHDQARSLNRLAYVVRLQGNFNESKKLVETALELSKGAKTEQAYGYLVLGAIALDTRDWQNASIFFDKSQFLWKQTNNV